MRLKKYRKRVLWDITFGKMTSEEAKKGEAEDVLKKLLASGMTAEEILAKLQ